MKSLSRNVCSFFRIEMDSSVSMRTEFFLLLFDLTLQVVHLMVNLHTIPSFLSRLSYTFIFFSKQTKSLRYTRSYWSCCATYTPFLFRPTISTLHPLLLEPENDKTTSLKDFQHTYTKWTCWINLHIKLTKERPHSGL